MLKFLLGNLAVYVNWFIALLNYWLDPPSNGVDLLLCWPIFTVPLIVIHFLVEIIALKVYRFYHRSLIFQRIWLLICLHELVAIETVGHSLSLSYADRGALIYTGFFGVCMFFSGLLGPRSKTIADESSDDDEEYNRLINEV